MDTLPKELVEMIFETLPVMDLASTLLVCKPWRKLALADRLWKQHSDIRFGGPKVDKWMSWFTCFSKAMREWIAVKEKSEASLTILWAARRGHNAVLLYEIPRNRWFSPIYFRGGYEFRGALFGAVRCGHNESVRILLAEKKTRTHYIIEKLVPLAVKRGNLELVKIFINYSEGSTAVTTVKADVDHKLVRIAVKSGSIPMLELMIEQGGDITKQSEKQKTLLHKAVRSGKKEMVQYLLDKGFILLPKDGALHAACQKASLAIFHLLINHPSKHYEEKTQKYNAKKRGTDFTLLHAACLRTQPSFAFIHHILDNGADVTVKYDGDNLVGFILRKTALPRFPGCMDLMKRLLQMKTPLNRPVEFSFWIDVHDRSAMTALLNSPVDELPKDNFETKATNSDVLPSSEGTNPKNF